MSSSKSDQQAAGTEPTKTRLLEPNQKQLPPSPPMLSTSPSNLPTMTKYRAQATWEQQQIRNSQEVLMNKLNKHIAEYPIRLQFPANIASSEDVPDSPTPAEPADSNNLRTSHDFVQHRLLESGMLYDEYAPNGQPLGNISFCANSFVNDMLDTGCYDNVVVSIDKSPDQADPPEEEKEEVQNAELNVILKEKNWYKLYVGGGFKQGVSTGVEGVQSSRLGDGGMFPTVQFEATGSLVNIRGYTDITTMSYTLDQNNIASMRCTHDSPLFSLFGNANPQRDTSSRPSSFISKYISNAILLSTSSSRNKRQNVNNSKNNSDAVGHGSKVHSRISGYLDTLDYEATRGYREFQRALTFQASTLRNPNTLIDGERHPNTTFQWGMIWRDLLPRRDPLSPYHCLCSAQITSQTGSTLKHAIQIGHSSNGSRLNDPYSPTKGIDYSYNTEVAMPPGDIGFAKAECGLSLHTPLPYYLKDWSIHLSGKCGAMQPFSFKRSSNMKGSRGDLHGLVPYIADRFYAGGPMSLRGFQPDGIGPRADPVTSPMRADSPRIETSNNEKATAVLLSAPSDALGGDIYYTGAIAASAPVPSMNLSILSNLRFMTFLNAGTVSGLCLPVDVILKGTRVSAGVGLYTSTPYGRFEMTYALPLRHGPKDVRKKLQFGVSMSFF